MPGSHVHKTYDDEYVMYSFKVKVCPRADHHNWKHCPWKHDGEVAAQRRHPSVHKPTFCMNLKMSGQCAAGDSCPFSHNTFEMSLHPERYKTTLCNLGDKCNREICFFAHSHQELRTPEPMPLAGVDIPLPEAATGEASSLGGVPESLPDSLPQGGGVPVLYNGQVVELASSSYVNPVADAQGSVSVVKNTLQPIHEQQQLQLRMQQHTPQQGQQIMGSVSTGLSPASSGVMVARLVPLASNVGDPPMDQQQQQLLQDLAGFDSFTSQSCQPMQQQLLRQELGNFESFNSQGSLQLQQQSFTSQGSSLQQLQLGQQSFSSTRQGEGANLRGDLAGVDSFSTQSSRGGLATLQQLQQHSAGQVPLQQDLSNFESFTSQGSRSAGSMAMLQQLQQQLAGPLPLRQDLYNFESFTSQSSRNGLSGVQQMQGVDPGPALMRQDYDSFTSQCSTSSQVLGAAFQSLPVSPLLQAGQGVYSSGAPFSGVQGSGGSFSVQGSGQSFTGGPGVQPSGTSFIGVPGVQPSGNSFTAQVSNRNLLGPMQAGAVVQQQPGLMYQSLPSGPTVAASSSNAGGQVLAAVSAAPGGLYRLVAPQQQQQMQDADLHQQMMQLQLHAQALWKLK